MGGALDSAKAIVVMGVSGAGKSTFGDALAKRLGYTFLEGDAFHPPANVEKMSVGIALNDEDRAPWLDAIGARMGAVLAAGNGVVAACSALRRIYRTRIAAAAGAPVTFILLDSPAAVLADRMAHRAGHFMPASLLASQLATLERPSTDEQAIILPGTLPLADLVDIAIARLAKS